MPADPVLCQLIREVGGHVAATSLNKSGEPPVRTLAEALNFDPEIAVVALAYNGKEGSTLAAPIVRKVIDSYFQLKAADADNGQ
jgi:tRNA A37 threonylcarbamoyladenosine synthetase subunit TsaC/SUA5/YrdC